MPRRATKIQLTMTGFHTANGATNCNRDATEISYMEAKHWPYPIEQKSSNHNQWGPCNLCNHCHCGCFANSPAVYLEDRGKYSEA